MTVNELYKMLESRIPKSLLCDWDNDGLMVSGNMDKEVKRVLVCLDATDRMIKKAVNMGYDALVCHHPMIFKGMKSVNEITMEGKRVLDALTGNLSVFSYHTRLDAVDGGVNDALCSALGFNASEKFGDDECPTLGRICESEEGISLSELAERVKKNLSAPYVKVASKEPEKKIHRIAVCGGDGKDMIKPAMKSGCDVLITGQGGYNAMQDSAEMGFSVIEAGHYYTENPVCSVLADWIRACGVECDIESSVDEWVI